MTADVKKTHQLWGSCCHISFTAKNYSVDAIVVINRREICIMYRQKVMSEINAHIFFVIWVNFLDMLIYDHRELASSPFHNGFLIFLITILENETHSWTNLSLTTFSPYTVQSSLWIAPLNNSWLWKNLWLHAPHTYQNFLWQQSFEKLYKTN